MTLCDRIAILNQGAIVQVGAPLEVYEHPLNRFAAGFLGVVNFLEGRVAAVSGQEARIDLALGGQAVAAAAGMQAGAPVVITLRPEKISLAAADGDAGPNRLNGAVTGAVFSGSSTTYRVAVGPQTLSVFQQNSAPGRFKAGDHVTLHWSPEHNVLVAP